MRWNEFHDALKAGNVPPVCLFTGPETLIKESTLNKLKEALLPVGLETLNDCTLEDVTAQQIIDNAQTMPMMCDRRIVTVRDWAPLLSGKSKNEEVDVERMKAFISDPIESCVLIFYMRTDCDGKKKLSQFLQKNACVVQFDPLSDTEMAKWCTAFLKPYKKKISPQTVGQLTFIAGRDLTRLKGELEKLAAFTEDRAEITEADIRQIVSVSVEYSIFELMNDLLAGDMQKAQKLLQTLYLNGQSPIALLAMLTRQVRQMLHMKCALEAGGTVVQVQNTLKMHPYAAKQTEKQCRKLTAKWLREVFDACVEADYAIKSGRMRDKTALDTIIFKIGFAENGNK